MRIKLHDATYVPFYRRVSYLFLPALFVLTSVLLEIIMFAFMHIAFPEAYIFSLSLLLIIAALVALIPNKWVQMVICTLLLGFQVTTTISNVISNATCDEIFSLETFKTFGAAFNAAGAISLGFWFLIPIIALLVVYIVCVVLIMYFCRVPRTYKQHNIWRPILCGLLAFVSFFSYTVAYSSLPSYKNGIENYVANLSNKKYIYDAFNNRVANLHTFGSYSYYFNNLIKLFGYNNKNTVAEVTELQPNTFALDDNEVLGEGYNLIMVLMETFERAAINPVTMPNLYRFMQESCVEVDGYYSIERTCFTDHIGQVGMHASSKEMWNNYGDVVVPHSLANIFNRSEDYVTAAFHGYDGNFYDRNKIFTKNFGFQSFNDFTTYTNGNERYTTTFAVNSDELLFKRNLNKIAPANDNFYSYIISISTHSVDASRYNLRDYYPAYFDYIERAENWDVLTKLYPVLLSEDPIKVLTAKNYLAGTCSFDLGFGALLEHLKNTPDQKHPSKKLIETTALVMFGDHYYYANPTALKPENENPSELIGNRCPFIVYNPRQRVEDPATHSQTTQATNAIKTNPENCGLTLRRFTSTMDIYPTVCSLFGVQTDQQLTYGHSIFDEYHDSLGVGYLGGYTWGVTGYDGSTEEAYTYNGVNYTYEKVNWQIWRTLDFVNFNGVTLTKKQVAEVTPLVNRTYASIFFDTSMYEQNGFKYLEKSKSYHLRAA